MSSWVLSRPGISWSAVMFGVPSRMELCRASPPWWMDCVQQMVAGTRRTDAAPSHRRASTVLLPRPRRPDRVGAGLNSLRRTSTPPARGGDKQSHAARLTTEAGLGACGNCVMDGGAIVCHPGCWLGPGGGGSLHGWAGGVHGPIQAAGHRGLPGVGRCGAPSAGQRGSILLWRACGCRDGSTNGTARERVLVRKGSTVFPPQGRSLSDIAIIKCGGRRHSSVYAGVTVSPAQVADRP